jgi:hypothetical protein
MLGSSAKKHFGWIPSQAFFWLLIIQDPYNMDALSLLKLKQAKEYL